MSMKQTCCRRSSFACHSVALHNPFSLPATQLLHLTCRNLPQRGNALHVEMLNLMVSKEGHR